MQTTRWGTIQGRPIDFPMEVAELNAATMLFSVASDAAAALLPGSAFEIVETAPGVAQLIISVCDYRQNPWGDYNEVNLGFLARPAGGPDDEIGSFVYRMPVNQAFTCEAGNQVMGFPKTVEEIEIGYAGSMVDVRLASEGRPALALRLPRVAGEQAPERIAAVSYSYLSGEPYATPLEMDMATGFVDPADVVIELGEGPIADELRSLGLPRPPDWCGWGEGLSATFQLGVSLAHRTEVR
ncbi:MAG: hypothetical protein QOG39_729 [Acidimicrobiaceae bacterium]